MRCTDALLNDLHVPTDAILCNDWNCTNEDHIYRIGKFVDDIVDALHSAGQHLTKPRKTQHKNYNRPGWTDYCSDLYQSAREVYLEWLSKGKPRQGQLFELKNKMRARFKGALRFIKSNEEALKRESLAKELYNMNPNIYIKI